MTTRATFTGMTLDDIQYLFHITEESMKRSVQKTVAGKPEKFDIRNWTIEEFSALSYNIVTTAMFALAQANAGGLEHIKERHPDDTEIPFP